MMMISKTHYDTFLYRIIFINFSSKVPTQLYLISLGNGITPFLLLSHFQLHQVSCLCSPRCNGFMSSHKESKKFF
ncbi:hypothetical protein BDV12DRAFT_5411 [Aspergillus spectabilis]